MNLVNDFEFVYHNREITIVGYIGKNKYVYVPSKIDGLEVTTIASKAFDKCDSMVTLELPNTIKTIDFAAFSFCRNLEKVILPNSITFIGNSIFYGCDHLKEITIDKKNIKNVYAYDVIYNITDNNEVIKSMYITQELIFETRNIYYNLLINLNIKDKVFYIHDDLKQFSKELIKDYILKYNGILTDTIENNCFIICRDNKSNIKDLDIYDSFDLVLFEKNIISSIQRAKMFYTKMIEEDNQDKLHLYLSAYKRITLDKIYTIMDDCKDKNNLMSYLIDYKNKNFTMKQIEKYEQDKEDKAFGLKEYTLKDWRKIYSFRIIDNYKITITKYKGKDTHVVIPEIIDGNIVYEVDPYTFKNSDVESVVFPDTVKNIWGDCFYGCKHLNEIVLPKNLKEMDSYLFSDCYGLCEYTIQDSIKKIGECAFIRCSNLTTIHIPNTIKQIPYGAFSNCRSLKYVFLEEGLTSISKAAFLACPSLEEIVIPASVQVIEQGAFIFCYNLKKVILLNKETDFKDKEFFNVEYR